MDAADKKAKLYREKACIDCGAVVKMHIKSKRCQECQAEANKRNNQEHMRAKANGHTRLIGSEDYCQRCGKPYTVEGGRQRYCKDCAQKAVAENVRDAAKKRYAATYATPESRERRQEKRRSAWKAYRICRQCGELFMPDYPQQVCCCKNCQDFRKKVIDAGSDIKRRPERLEKLKAERQKR